MSAPTADLLQHVSDFVGRFVVLPSESATTTVALLVLHTWALDAAHATPYLTIVSPEKENGKSRLATWKRTHSFSESARSGSRRQTARGRPLRSRVRSTQKVHSSQTQEGHWH